MLPFDLNAVILLVLGSLLTIVGGLATTYVTLHLNTRAAKRTLTREKIEEIYLLTNQIKRWSQTQLFELSKKAGVPSYQYIFDSETLKQMPKPLYDMDLEDLTAILKDLKQSERAAQQSTNFDVRLAYLKKMARFDPMQGFKFWYVFEPPAECECPIDRLKMLINLYLPEMNISVDTYDICIFNVQSLMHREVKEQEIRDIILLFEISHRGIQAHLEERVLNI